MDSFQRALVLMVVTDTQWSLRDEQGRGRVLTAEELDARVDFGWHVPDFRGYVTACRNAALRLWQLPGRPRTGTANLTSVESC